MGLDGELLMEALVVLEDENEAALTFCFSAAFWKNDSREVVAFLMAVIAGPLPWVLASELVVGSFDRELELPLKKMVMSVQDGGLEAQNLLAQRKSIVSGGDLYIK